MDLVNAKKQKSFKPAAFDLCVDLFEPTSTSYPHFNIPSLLREKYGNDLTADCGFNRHYESEDHKKLQEIAKRFEEKYGADRKSDRQYRFGRLEDHVDYGMGYDQNDSFIDDTEAYDELVPSTMTTKYGGFYVNAGPLELREVSSDEEDTLRSPHCSKEEKSSSAIRKRVKLMSSGSEDESVNASTSGNDLLSSEHDVDVHDLSDKSRCRKLSATVDEVCTSTLQSHGKTAASTETSKPTATSMKKVVLQVQRKNELKTPLRRVALPPGTHMMKRVKVKNKDTGGSIKMRDKGQLTSGNSSNSKISDVSTSFISKPTSSAAAIDSNARKSINLVNNKKLSSGDAVNAGVVDRRMHGADDVTMNRVLESRLDDDPASASGKHFRRKSQSDADSGRSTPVDASANEVSLPANISRELRSIIEELCRAAASTPDVKLFNSQNLNARQSLLKVDDLCAKQDRSVVFAFLAKKLNYTKKTLFKRIRQMRDASIDRSLPDDPNANVNSNKVHTEAGAVSVRASTTAASSTMPSALPTQKIVMKSNVIPPKPKGQIALGPSQSASVQGHKVVRTTPSGHKIVKTSPTIPSVVSVQPKQLIEGMCDKSVNEQPMKQPTQAINSITDANNTVNGMTVDAAAQMQIRALYRLVNQAMPPLLHDYAQRCTIAQLERSTQSAQEGKKVGGHYVRKKFAWSDDTRNIVLGLVKAWLANPKNFEGTESVELALKKYLEQITKCWPKDWMTVQQLYRESKSAHEHLTGPASANSTLDRSKERLAQVQVKKVPIEAEEIQQKAREESQWPDQRYVARGPRSSVSEVVTQVAQVVLPLNTKGDGPSGSSKSGYVKKTTKTCDQTVDLTLSPPSKKRPGLSVAVPSVSSDIRNSALPIPPTTQIEARKECCVMDSLLSDISKTHKADRPPVGDTSVANASARSSGNNDNLANPSPRQGSSTLAVPVPVQGQTSPGSSRGGFWSPPQARTASGVPKHSTPTKPTQRQVDPATLHQQFGIPETPYTGSPVVNYWSPAQFIPEVGGSTSMLSTSGMYDPSPPNARTTVFNNAQFMQQQYALPDPVLMYSGGGYRASVAPKGMLHNFAAHIRTPGSSSPPYFSTQMVQQKVTNSAMMHSAAPAEILQLDPSLDMNAVRR